MYSACVDYEVTEIKKKGDEPIALHASGYAQPATERHHRHRKRSPSSPAVLSSRSWAAVTNVTLAMLAVAVYVGSSVAPTSTFESVVGGHWPQRWKAV
jgi:hypothetical protein